MNTHPLWRPFALFTSEELDKVWVSATRSRIPRRRIQVVPPDPSWPEQFSALAVQVRAALGDRVVALDHVGSTSVPGLAAKPIIDLDLTVADSADEDDYVPALEAVGYELQIREPEWEQHRCLVQLMPRCNLHVFPPGAIEPQRHLLFRRWLSTNADDHAVYAALKLDLAEREFDSVMTYNNEKAGLIYDIYERIFAADSRFDHDPHPRSDV